MEYKAPLKIISHDQFCIEKIPDPCGIVIFGASGDLSRRKLIPALCDLYHAKLFPKGFFVVGFARTPMTDESFRKEVLDSLSGRPKCEGDKEKEFLERFHYQAGDYNDPKGFRLLAERFKELHSKHNTRGNVLFYLATPPVVYRDVVSHLAEAGLVNKPEGGTGWSRVVFEKPFGFDLESARKLNAEISRSLDESQIYRIDHYLGKETVQNILILRFTNSIFEPVWNRRYIDHVQITAAETLGVERRAGYFDQAGSLRDMFQNHMFQLLSLVAMEPPYAFSAEEYRNEKAKVLRSIREVPAAQLDQFVIRGQYGRGRVGDKEVCAYREEKLIKPDSNTETFTALKLFVDNWRWQDVPFYLRSGKRLGAHTTEIAIQFKTIPHSIFSSIGINEFPPNVLTLRIQPNEGISLSFEAKHPGPKFCMATLNLAFNYKDAFQEEPLGAYQRLLLDCMLGDQTLFVRQDMVDLSWNFVTKILDHWKKLPPPGFPNYEAGSWGPRESDDLLKKDGRFWKNT